MAGTQAIVALDIGERRIGVAVANTAARLAAPLTTVEHNSRVMEELVRILQRQQAIAVVVGLPRGLSGQHTAQTTAVEAFVLQLRQYIDLPIYWQDEALTSKQAEVELQSRHKPFTKADIDALAANYILEDFLKEHFKEPET